MAMNTQTADQPLRLTVVEGGLREVGESELPYAFDLKNLFRNLMYDTDQMSPSER
jgi:hypothetical protein